MGAVKFVSESHFKLLAAKRFLSALAQGTVYISLVLHMPLSGTTQILGSEGRKSVPEAAPSPPLHINPFFQRMQTVMIAKGIAWFFHQWAL
ncbi:MAG: Uncharacterised protein [SAR116 cluster bacterium]|nr:MAG: Uncharacterised protein [SAR116 cluster bacterium]